MKIGLFGSDYQAEKQSRILLLFEKLIAHGATVYADAAWHACLSAAIPALPPVAGLLDGEVSGLDLALSVGGDGTFLRTAARINRHHIPILGINTGRLGFLADVSSLEIEETLEDLFRGHYRVEERTLLRLSTEGQLYQGYNYALNEVAILKRDTSSMILIHTLLDGEYLASYQADGLVIATPTGSTAYSMSVNGPVIVPQSNSIILSPVAPHSLNVRPLVIPDTAVIRLTIESRSDSFLIALDGRSEVFPVDTALTITKADYTTRIIKRHGHTFYQTLREKLMWGADPRMK